MPIHFEFLLEELSMEAFLQAWLPRFLPEGHTFKTYPHQGKRDLLEKLEARLRGYANWLPQNPGNYRIVIIVDRDNDDCKALKTRLEKACANARLRSRRAKGSGAWQVATRIAIEELEAWYFGDWDAVRQAYPRVPANVRRRQSFRQPDAIAGGTWERFEMVMKRSGYADGLQKIEAARAIGGRIDDQRSDSHSFRCLVAALREALTT